MPRPCKKRRICELPKCKSFGPDDCISDESRMIFMTFDEYEAVRLIDLENMTQEECAGQMNVARTTAQAIYKSARTKLAESLINRKILKIEGGNFVLCSGRQPDCAFRRQHGWCCSGKTQPGNGENDSEPEPVHPKIGNSGGTKIRLTPILLFDEKGSSSMKIAVPYDNGQVFQHFGRSEFFKIYDVNHNQIEKSEIISTNGTGHCALIDLLEAAHAEILLCGGIGGGASQRLKESGIKFCSGVSGDADQAVSDFISGKLVSAADEETSCCHESSHEKNCGEGDCGRDSCSK